MFVDNIEKRLNVPKEIFKDPEQFLLNKYYNQKPPGGFRIELLAARKYNLICDKLKQCKPAHFFAKHSQKTFCPYCEKTVIPRRLHKLDSGDIVLLLLTAGLWLVFLLVMYLFIRRCPVCNYNLRGFKSLSKK
jgi:uncharacterized paraquat-inducible protein A